VTASAGLLKRWMAGRRTDADGRVLTALGSGRAGRAELWKRTSLRAARLESALGRLEAAGSIASGRFWDDSVRKVRRMYWRAGSLN